MPPPILPLASWQAPHVTSYHLADAEASAGVLTYTHSLMTINTSQHDCVPHIRMRRPNLPSRKSAPYNGVALEMRVTGKSLGNLSISGLRANIKGVLLVGAPLFCCLIRAAEPAQAYLITATPDHRLQLPDQQSQPLPSWVDRNTPAFWGH